MRTMDANSSLNQRDLQTQLVMNEAWKLANLAIGSSTERTEGGGGGCKQKDCFSCFSAFANFLRRRLANNGPHFLKLKNKERWISVTPPSPLQDLPLSLAPDLWPEATTLAETLLVMIGHLKVLRCGVSARRQRCRLSPLRQLTTILFSYLFIYPSVYWFLYSPRPSPSHAVVFCWELCAN